MKKILKNSLFLAATLMVFVSCETYKVAEPETTSVSPMDGRYVCLAYTNAADAAVDNWEAADEYFDVFVSGTTDDTPGELWINVCNYLNYYAATGTPFTEVICAKVKCDVKALTFASEGEIKSVPPLNQIKNWVYPTTYYTTYGYGLDETGIHDVEIGNGTIELDGYQTASSTDTDKYYADKISFDYTVDGVTYKVVGFRWTGWEEDVEHITNFTWEYMGWNE